MKFGTKLKIGGNKKMFKMQEKNFVIFMLEKAKNPVFDLKETLLS